MFHFQKNKPKHKTKTKSKEENTFMASVLQNLSAKLQCTKNETITQNKKKDVYFNSALLIIMSSCELLVRYHTYLA